MLTFGLDKQTNPQLSFNAIAYAIEETRISTYAYENPFEKRANFETAILACTVAESIIGKEPVENASQGLYLSPFLVRSHYVESTEISETPEETEVCDFFSNNPFDPETLRVQAEAELKEQQRQMRRETLAKEAREALKELFPVCPPPGAQSKNSKTSGQLLTYFNVQVGLKICLYGSAEIISKVVDKGDSKNIQSILNGNLRTFRLFRIPRPINTKAWIL